MPNYGVKNPQTGEIFDREFPSFEEFKKSLQEEDDGQGKYELIDGVKCYITWQPASTRNARSMFSSKNPHVLRSMGCPIEQKYEMEAASRKAGTNVEYKQINADTCAPALTSKGQYKNFLKKAGMHNKDDFY